ncbi:MAG: winged helix-turn-helix domain-containing protein [Methanotrichaceae archaeon]|nr:winged helix-turn-helix domain-containing protein [Methanotrichaceae archaeon]
MKQETDIMRDLKLAAPFEGLFGNTSELKVVQFLLPLSDLEFNISEIARSVGVTRQTLEPAIKKLTKWNVLKVVSKHGNANYYAMNEDSGFVEAFTNLNNRIIEQMLGEQELARIADYARERTQPCFAEAPLVRSELAITADFFAFYTNFDVGEQSKIATIEEIQNVAQTFGGKTSRVGEMMYAPVTA